MRTIKQLRRIQCVRRSVARLLSFTASGALFAFLIVGSASRVSAADSLTREVDFDIPSQSIESALLEFSKQADVQVMIGASSLGSQKSNSLKGKQPASGALRKLLQDTGLVFEAVGNTVTVKAAKPIATDASLRALVPWGATSADTRFAQQSVHSETPKSDGRPITDAPKSLQTSDEIVVTGTHIHGQGPVGSQLIVIDRDDIDKSGFATVQDVVRSLPQNFSGGPSEDTNLGLEASKNATRSSALNLRGLGAGSTLVLLNGRRLAPGGTEGTFVDVSSIPLQAIQRIEVLADGASAIYGSDAVGGVVNFIMRDDYAGAETQARFGSVTEGDLKETQVSQLLGTNWLSGNVVFSYEYYHRDSLAAEQRVLSADSDLQRFGGDNFSTQQSNPGNVAIGTQVWGIPRGQDGTTLGPSDLVPGATNFQNLNEGRDLLSEQERHSAFLSVSQSLTKAVKLSGDALYSQRSVNGHNPGLPSNLIIPFTNPFRVNPTGAATPVRVQYNFSDDLGPRTLDATVDSLSAALSANLKLARDWELTASVLYAGEQSTQMQGNVVNPTALAAALADPNPLTAFNAFADGSNTNPATLERIRAETYFSSNSEVQSANVIATGALFALPGGSVRLAAGADYRDQYFRSTNRPAGQANIVGPPYKRQVSAAFAEFFIPLITEVNRRPGFEAVELSIAGRYDDYSDFGSTANPKLGGQWSPIKGLSIHGNWGTSFKAPNLSDLDETNNLSFISSIPDPLSPSGQSPVLILFGKNAELVEETATSWTIGVKWSPTSRRSTVLDLTYFHVGFENRIQQAPNVASFLTDQARFAGIVTRNPTAAQRESVCSRSTFQVSLGDCLSSPVAALIDERTNNTSAVETSGLDFIGSLEVPTQWGTFEVTANATYLLDFSQAQTPTSASVSLVNTVSNPLRFRMRDSVSWSQGGFGVTAFVNYAGSYSDNLTIPNRDVDSWTTLDLQLSYQAGSESKSWLAGCLFTLSAQNLLDSDPPFVNNSAGVGYDRENADLLGRFVSIQARKSW